jgi:tetratricopeptide (TPR) repeat protein
VALTGLLRYSLHTDKLTATIQIAEKIHSLAQEQNDDALMIEAYRALAVTAYYSGDYETAQRYARRAVQIWRSGNVQSYTEAPQTPVIVCLCYRGVFLSALGADEPQIEASFCEAIRTAKEQKSVSLEKRAEATYEEYRRQKASGSGGRGIRLPLW